MSKWRFGCGTQLTVYTPRGRAVSVDCGSTSFSGGVNQCSKCEHEQPVSEPREEEGDLEWDERQAFEREENRW